MSPITAYELHMQLAEQAIQAVEIDLRHLRERSQWVDALPGAICWLKVARKNLARAEDAAHAEAQLPRRVRPLRRLRPLVLQSSQEAAR